MKYWEFLIQKEGDQTWLPLETQQVEILEGRYRVVAHTDRVNTPMEVQVSQLITDELPPRKRVRKRTSRTNESGLVVVVPYVHLKPGQWELICSSDAIDDLVGDGWQYSVQLQVFAHTEEDWSAEWPVPSDSETAASMIVDDETDLDPDFRPDSPLVQAQAELESHLQEKRSRQNGHHLATPVFAAGEGPADLERYQIVLRQQAFLAQHNLPMTIVGKVNALAEALQDDTSQLWIRLQNPETAQVIMEAHRPLSLARLPADFKVQIQLPVDVTTRVILGEVSLRSPAIDPGDTVKILASTAFTITAGIAQLLDAIANQAADMFTGVVEEDVATAALTPETAQVSLFPQSAPNPAIAMPLLDPTQQANQHGTQQGIQQGTMPAVGVVVPSHPDGALDTGVQPQLPSFVEPSQRANLIVSDGPSHSTAVDAEDLAATAVDANTVNNDVTAQMPSAADLAVAEPPVAEPPTPEPPAVVPTDRIIQQVPVVSQPAQFLGTSIEDSDLEADEIAAVLEDIDQDLRSEESDLDALEPPGIEGALPSQSDTYSTRRSPAPTTRQTAPQPPDRSASKSANGSPDSSKSDSAKLPTQRVETNVDFQSLRLKDHFWDRLSSLTHDSHREATQLAKSMREAGVSRDRSSLLPAAPAFAYDNEVVIYDEPAPSSAAPASSTPASSIPAPSTPTPSAPTPTFRPGESLSDRLSRGPAAKPDSPAQVASSEELPDMVLPVISVPIGDLVAGEMISVTVRTRPSVYKPFIKLWMIDRQSRSLVIEPQLLTSLKPDALGDLEATTELRVPMDCLDVQIAAIAVDMATQQESNKAIVNRHVVPSARPATRGFSF